MLSVVEEESGSGEPDEINRRATNATPETAWVIRDAEPEWAMPTQSFTVD